MMLAIDIGNTNIVWGIFENKKLISVYRINSNKNDLHNISFLSNYNIKKIIISSVVPSLTNEIQKFCIKKINLNPFIIKYNNVSNLKMEIDNPSQLGTDRICNIIAAKSLYKLPSIIIDMGTATKYDIINPNGVFIGGVISPGIELSAMNLFEKAELLNKTSFKFPNNVIGKNTKSNIQSGIMYGSIDSINGMVNRIIKETKWKDLSIIMTGGFSEVIKSKVSKSFIFNPNLTLEGLNFIHHNLSK